MLIRATIFWEQFSGRMRAGRKDPPIFWEPFSGKSIGRKNRATMQTCFSSVRVFHSDIRHANANTAIRASEVAGTCRRPTQQKI